MSIASRLYHGQISFDYVGRWRTWFLVSALAMLISVIALIYPGLRFGIDFKGGGVFTVQPTHNVTQAQVSSAVGQVAKVVQTSNVESGKPAQVQVQTESLTSDQIAKVRADLARVAGVQPSQVSNSVVGSKWGSTVTRKALIALAVFLAVIVVYVSIRFDFKMSVSALVALIHDLLITAGVYALARFEVTPATVIGLLTILGYSLYDTVVVFDKVRENTGELSAMSRVTYSEAANRAINQTLVRSLNTSLTSLLPIGALLLAGAILPGGETIKDLSLALFVGVASGTYSSIFIATPFLALWKETEPRYRQLNARVSRLVASGGTAGEGEPQGRVRQGARQGGQRRSVAAERRRALEPPEEAASPAPAGRRPRKANGDRIAPDEAPMLEPDVPNGLHLERDEEQPEPLEEPARAAAARQPQKPRPSQQRRKPSGRQRSGSSKRRRR